MKGPKLNTFRFLSLEEFDGVKVMNKIFKCDVCGNIVELIHVGGGELVCCGQPMNLAELKEKEEGTEKHLPVVTRADLGVLVNVGEVDHPMEEAHYIEWIEVVTDVGTYRKYLKPGEKPSASFCTKEDRMKSVREYCSVHGLWGTKA